MCLVFLHQDHHFRHLHSLHPHMFLLYNGMTRYWIISISEMAGGVKFRWLKCNIICYITHLDNGNKDIGLDGITMSMVVPSSYWLVEREKKIQDGWMLAHFMTMQENFKVQCLFLNIDTMVKVNLLKIFLLRTLLGSVPIRCFILIFIVNSLHFI